MIINKKTFFNIALAAIIATLVSSCLKTDDHDITYSADEERALRGAYIDSLISNDHDIDTTANGVYYVVIEEGEGEFAKEGDTLTVGYAGYFIDGVMFDSSELHFPEGKMEFILGVDRMIPGWEEGIQKMNEGARMQFIIPSELAYGSAGSGRVAPYQTLVFVTRMFEIQPSE